MESGRPLDEAQLELLRLVMYGRDTATLRFLLCERLPGATIDVEGELAAMQAQGWVALDDTGRRWERTTSGEDHLRSNDDWEFVVEEVFKISGRPHPSRLEPSGSGTSGPATSSSSRTEPAWE